MAEKQKTTQKAKKAMLIDPVYQKFTKGVMRAISSTDFYEYFMDAISKAENEFQFSNRKLEKAVDMNWVECIERALPAIQEIIENPRNIIREEDLIVNAAIAKRAGSDVVRHLTQHASFVEDYNDKTGDVRPTKLMQKIREDSEELYENRLVFTALEMAYHFVKIRHDALFEAMNSEYGAKLKVKSEMESATEMVHLEMFLHIREKESTLNTDAKYADIFNRVSRLYRILTSFMNTRFAQQMSKVARVKGSIIKTNILKKNPVYRKVAQLLEYLRSYDQIGYSIRVIEQAPQINEVFQRDIYHNILFNYLILKGYLEDDSSRVVVGAPRERQRTLKPKFIREIVEELTEDYNLPDVEIRKVLIEELTKEQLMHEEAEQRRKLVEEQARKKKEEAERIRKEKEAEKERIRKEKEAEKERLRAEKEAEKERLETERIFREMEDRRRSTVFRKELDKFAKRKEERLNLRQKFAAKYLEEQETFADAARLVEEAERRKHDALERKRRREQEALEQLQQQREAELARQQQEALERQIAIDMALLERHNEELRSFAEKLAARKELRVSYMREQQERKERLEQQRRQTAKKLTQAR